MKFCHNCKIKRDLGILCNFITCLTNRCSETKKQFGLNVFPVFLQCILFFINPSSCFYYVFFIFLHEKYMLTQYIDWLIYLCALTHLCKYSQFWGPKTDAVKTEAAKRGGTCYIPQTRWGSQGHWGHIH